MVGPSPNPLGYFPAGGLVVRLLILGFHVPRLHSLKGGKVLCGSGPPARERTVASSAEIGIASPGPSVSVWVI